jgi:putative nucleotidyltransferase with HDIG domain
VETITLTDRRAALVVELTQHALAAPSVPDAVGPILQSFVLRTAAEGAAYFQTNGRTFQARAASGVMPTGPVMAAILAHGLPADSPLIVALDKATSPLFFDDTSATPITAGFPDLGVASLAAAPVRGRQGGLLGAFLMHTFERHDWTESEADLVAAVANALAALTARLVAEEDAVAAREGAIRALGLALESRDGETKGHTDRVTDLALRLGTTLGLDENDLSTLRWGAYLHDIGKIGVPDAILLKPGRLDEAEWTVMREHVALGHAFARRLPFLPSDVLEVVRHHHERWDGTGYPDGLRGTEIPMSARVFALCDVYDALTSVRPYKRAWTHHDAFAEIAAQSGRHFDPAIVAVFLSLDLETID